MAIRLAEDRCVGRGACVAPCPAGALWLDETRLRVDDACTECGVCESLCPVGALTLGHAWPTFDRRPLRSHYDVLVVGAGPAGSMAAEAVARAGLSALLLEKRQEIGSPVRCAEGVSRASLRELLEPDARCISASVSAAEAVRAGAADRAHLLSYERSWQSQWGRDLACNYRLRGRFPGGRRASSEFLRVFAMAAAGK